MHTLKEVAPSFVEMAHRIVWASAATVDAHGRPRSRILHPIWEWDGTQLTGWIATGPSPSKVAHLKASPYLSLNYWIPTHDTCVADCRVTWAFDDQTRIDVWNKFLNAPPPVGYNPADIEVWKGPTSDTFAALKLEPWGVRVFPGSIMQGQGGTVLSWRA